MGRHLAPDDQNVAALARIVRETPWLCEVLRVVRELGPPEAYVAAGAVRDTVWNVLTGRPRVRSDGDVDVVYWSDPSAIDASQVHEARLRAASPEFDWEVTNQATVHLWHRRARGVVIAPHQCVADGVASWPETATAVGVRLTAEGDLDVLAPLGLADLFELRLRHNVARAAPDVFLRRLAAKQWLRRWPELQLA